MMVKLQGDDGGDGGQCGDGGGGEVVGKTFIYKR